VNTLTKPWVIRNKWVVMAVGIPALVAAWWAFRPEKLWINQKVNEAAPFAASNDPQPIYTGRLEGKAHPTEGRASVYKNVDGKLLLRLTNFSTSNGPDVHVVLARGDDQSLQQEIVKSQLDNLELGTLKGNKGDQNYDVPASADLEKYNAVVIYCERFHAVFGVAKLEAF
jgi:hypothetical protein